MHPTTRGLPEPELSPLLQREMTPRGPPHEGWGISKIDRRMLPGQAPGLKFWVLDVLFWGDLAMVGCEAEMRVFWAASKVDEVGSGAEQFSPVLYAPAEGGNIQQAYQGTGVPYVRDGLLFLHREGHYFGGAGGKDSLSLRLWLSCGKT